MSALAELGNRLRAAAAKPHAYPEGRFEGRGIVICAGGARLFTCAWIAIGVLRRYLKSTLPIEVWHLGPEEMGPSMRGLIQEWGVETVDAHEVARRHAVETLGGWELKPFALMHSRFREVLLLDADNLPIRDPAFLFDLPEYAAAGALFWPDRVRLTPDNDVWAVAGLEFRDMPSLESGQMVVDKSRCWPELALTHWINQYSDAFYRFLHGDKDTFLIAWLMLGRAFHVIAHQAKLIQSTKCQRAPDGSVLFQHRHSAKWILNGDNPRIPGFRLEEECRRLMTELAAVWDGTVFNPPRRSPEARRIERELAAQRNFVRRRITSDEFAVELLPDHRLRGALQQERCWYVADGPVLCVVANGIPMYELAPSADGVWRGRWAVPPGMPVELAPSNAPSAPAPVAEGAALLVEPILALAGSLPWDREVARDIAGALRVIATIDPAVAGLLREENGRAEPGSRRAQALRAALDGLAPGQPKIGAGHGWTSPSFRLGAGYRL